VTGKALLRANSQSRIDGGDHCSLFACAPFLCYATERLKHRLEHVVPLSQHTTGSSTCLVQEDLGLRCSMFHSAGPLSYYCLAVNFRFSSILCSWPVISCLRSLRSLSISSSCYSSHASCSRPPCRRTRNHISKLRANILHHEALRKSAG